MHATCHSCTSAKPTRDGCCTVAPQRHACTEGVGSSHRGCACARICQALHEVHAPPLNRRTPNAYAAADPAVSVAMSPAQRSGAPGWRGARALRQACSGMRVLGSGGPVLHDAQQTRVHLQMPAGALRSLQWQGRGRPNCEPTLLLVWQSPEHHSHLAPLQP